MARSIAEKRGRNAKWAEDAVRKSVSITETEALKERVIDLVAPDVPSLLKEINGKTVDLVVGKKTLDTSNAQVQEINMGFRYKILEHHQQSQYRLHPYDPRLLRPLLRTR